MLSPRWMKDGEHTTCTTIPRGANLTPQHKASDALSPLRQPLRGSVRLLPVHHPCP